MRILLILLLGVSAGCAIDVRPRFVMRLHCYATETVNLAGTSSVAPVEIPLRCRGMVSVKVDAGPD